MRSCEVLLNRKKTGILEEDDSRHYTFTYDKDYLALPNARPVSLTLPLRKAPYRSKWLFPAFANILSEGSNRRLQSRLHHIDPSDDFGIMLETCTFDTIGAITVKPLKK